MLQRNRENIGELVNYQEAQRQAYLNFFSHQPKEKTYNLDFILSTFLTFKLDDKLSIVYDGFDFEPISDEEILKIRNFNLSKTVSAKLHIYVNFMSTEEDGSQKLLSREKFFLCNIPYILKNNIFFVNGFSRIFVPGLLKNKGIYSIEMGQAGSRKKELSVCVRPEFGIKFNLVVSKKNSQVYVLINKQKINFFLLFSTLLFDNLEQFFSFLFEKKAFSNNISDEELEEIINNKMISFEVLHDYSSQFKSPTISFRELEKTYKEHILRNREFTQSFYYDIPNDIMKYMDNNIILSDFYSANAANSLYRKIRGSKVIFDYLPELRKFFLDINRFDFGNLGRRVINRKLDSDITTNGLTSLVIKNIFFYLLDLDQGKREKDDSANISNRYICFISFFLYGEFRNIFVKIQQYVLDKFENGLAMDDVVHNIKQLLSSCFNNKSINKKIMSLFTQHPNCQFLDQTNPLSELLHKYKLIFAGQGGLNKEYATSEFRSVHDSYFGRICCLSTPEGQSAGLVNFAAMYAKVDKYGFLYAPYQKVNNGKIEDEIVYIDAFEEYQENYIIAPFNIISPDQKNDRILCKQGRGFVYTDISKINFVQAYPNQSISLGASLVPFFKYNDSNRNTTASNMQRQACPLLFSEEPIVKSGFEELAAQESSYCIYSETDGIVSEVDSQKIILKDEKGKEYKYFPRQLLRSNQDSSIGHRVLISKGQKVKKGELLADSLSTFQGKLSLGVNLRTAIMPFKGLNFEDSVVISDRCVKEGLLSSLLIKEFIILSKKTKLGNEIITKDMPNYDASMLDHLDDEGVIKVGTFVTKNKILVGKLTPKVSSLFSKSSDKLWRKVIGDNSIDYQNTSLLYNDNEPGTVVSVFRHVTDSSSDSFADVNEVIKIWVTRQSLIKAGDKICGRYGNKQIISQVLPVADMPYTADGRPIDVVMNPLGVPSRMNIGQLMEVHCNLVNEKEKILEDASPFSIMDPDIISQELVSHGFRSDGKLKLFDGVTGEQFKSEVVVGDMYILKLEHMVDLKFHARSVGPNSMLTLQPVGGKNRSGGQRCGEMEQWVLEAHGVSLTILEKNIILSDDIKNLEKLLSIIIFRRGNFEDIKSNTFYVFQSYLFSLGLELQVLSKQKRVKIVKKGEKQ